MVLLIVINLLSFPCTTISLPQLRWHYWVMRVTNDSWKIKNEGFYRNISTKLCLVLKMNIMFKVAYKKSRNWFLCSRSGFITYRTSSKWWILSVEITQFFKTSISQAWMYLQHIKMLILDQTIDRAPLSYLKRCSGMRRIISYSTTKTNLCGHLQMIGWASKARKLHRDNGKECLFVCVRSQ